MLLQNLKTLMKHLFYNLHGANTVIITCQNRHGTFNLYYHLYNNPVQYAWQEIHKSNTNIIMGRSSAVGFRELLEKLNYYCKLENVSELSLNLTTEDLNILHHKYVLSNHNKNWFNINLLIHAIESKLENSLLLDFDSCLNFYSDPDAIVPIKEEYKIFLNTDIVWGRLQLGYATLGKDWIDLYQTNDNNLDDLVIQSKITSETLMLFCPESIYHSVKSNRFYHWSKQSGIDIPLSDLNQLSLGKYPLGQIIISDIFLKFHSTASDWYVPNHKCKLTWNKEFFTSDTVVIKVDFKNTDMLYESLLAHTTIGSLLDV